MSKIYYDWKDKLFAVNRLRKEGISVHEAVLAAGCSYVSYYAWVKRWKRELDARKKSKQ
jgi:transposase